MVASAENTARKYMEVRKALSRSNRPETFLSASRIVHKNAPTNLNVYGNMLEALDYTGGMIIPKTLNQAIAFFTVAPLERRAYITSAYNKLPQLHRELNAIAPKIIAARRIQKHWRAAQNKRRVSALLALNKKGSVPNTTRAIMKLVVPNSVSKHIHWTKRKYSTY